MVPDAPDDTIRNEIDEIDTALKRISAGIYSECVVYSQNRLETLPYATKCITSATQ